MKFQIFNITDAANPKLVALLDARGLRKIYEMDADEVRWSLEEYGVCTFELEDREFAIVSSDTSEDELNQLLNDYTR